MSFLTSDFNLCVFKLPEDFNYKPSEIYDKMKAKSFIENPIGHLERNTGWVAVDDCFKTDFIYEDVCAADYVVAGYRCDVKRVSHKLVSKLVKDRLKERKKDGIKVTKEDKAVLKDICRDELLAKVLPNPSSFGCIIDSDNRSVYLDCNNPTMIVAFMNLFIDTFNCILKIENYDIVDNQAFLEWLWVNVSNLEGVWLENMVSIKDDEDTFNFSSSALNDYVLKINDMKSGKHIKKMGLMMAVKDLDYILFLNNKNMVITLKNRPKIKHESVETAVIDNVDRILIIKEKLLNMSKMFLQG